jgi:Family of unknown function (DUF5427)
MEQGAGEGVENESGFCMCSSMIERCVFNVLLHTISLLRANLIRLSLGNVPAFQRQQPTASDSRSLFTCLHFDKTCSTQSQIDMATKKTKKPDDDLLAQLDDLGAQAASRPSKSIATRAARQGQPSQSSQTEQDLLAELGNLAQRPASRPGTPSLKPNAATAGSRSPTRSTATPPARSSEEKSQSGQRKSNDSTRSTYQAFTPATTTTEESPEPSESTPAPAKSGGWWGSILSTATAAVTQAQAAVQEIQKNEDAQRYFEQVRGNVSTLRGFGTFSLFLCLTEDLLTM